MKPKFQLGQRVWCFDSDNYYTGIVRSVEFSDVCDTECRSFKYNVLVDLDCDAVASLEVFTEEQLTEDPLKAKEAERLKASGVLNSLNASLNAEKATIRRMQSELNVRKENMLVQAYHIEKLEETIKQVKGKKK